MMVMLLACLLLVYYFFLCVFLCLIYSDCKFFGAGAVSLIFACHLHSGLLIETIGYFSNINVSSIIFLVYHGYIEIAMSTSGETVCLSSKVLFPVLLLIY